MGTSLSKTLAIMQACPLQNRDQANRERNSSRAQDH